MWIKDSAAKRYKAINCFNGRRVMSRPKKLAGVLSCVFWWGHASHVTIDSFNWSNSTVVHSKLMCNMHAIN